MSTDGNSGGSGGVGGGVAGGDGSGGTSGGSSGGHGEKTYVQADVNRLLAENKKNLQREAQQNKEAYETLHQQVEEMLQGKPFEEFRAEAETTAAKLRSVEEQFKIDQSKAQKALQQAQEAAKTYETKYRDSTITRALKDAATDKASTKASINLIAELLKPNSAVGDDGTVTVEMEVEEEGVKIKKKLTPEEAVAVLESRPSDWGPLFKSTVSGGSGNMADGVMRKDGKLDISKMTMEQYVEARKKDPNFTLNVG